MSQVPTVRVKHADGYMVINAADFDPSVHQPFDETKKPDEAGGKKAGVKKPDEAGGKK
jgi:hypothetical protein